MPEPHNKYDSNAIMVCSPYGQVGYLSGKDAKRYQPVFAALSRRGAKADLCLGVLLGGSRDKPFFGVVLYLAEPDRCLARISGV